MTDPALEARRQDPRYQRLMTATREAARGGYEAVSMRDLAEKTRMSLTSVYQFCSSKDHLIAEAHLEGMEDFRRMLSTGGRRGGTVESRVLRVMRGIVNGLERDEVLTRTLMRAIYSLDAGAGDVSRSLGVVTREMLFEAIGDADIRDRDVVVETLGRVVDSAVYGWLARGETVDDVRALLEQTVHLLFGSQEQPTAPRAGRGRAAKGASSRSLS
jgi:TetR/AcrR family transcriptional regulator, cholesterol catabolism regulator